MSEPKIDFNNQPIDLAVQRASWAEILGSRPARLEDRVCTYAAILANVGLEETTEAIQGLAFFDDVVIPAPADKGLDFNRVLGIYSPEVADAIKALARKGTVSLTDNATGTDWVMPCTLSRAAFEVAYARRWTPWGFFLWCFVESLTDSEFRASGGDPRPRVHVNNTGRDLQWVIESLPFFQQWKTGLGSPRQHAGIMETYDQLAKVLEEPVDVPDFGKGFRPIPTKVRLGAILARYLCVLTDKRLPPYEDFGGRRFMRVLDELRVVAGMAPCGTEQAVVFLKGDEVVGRLQYREETETLQQRYSGKLAPKFNTIIVNKNILTAFSVEEAHRGQGIGQVMIRHAMTNNVRIIPAPLAKPLAPLACRHGIADDDGEVMLANVSWGRVKAL